MIRIVHNDKDLDVGDLKMSFKFTNPLFSDKIFSDGYSFPFTLPYTAKNISVLSSANRLDNIVIKKEFKVKIYFFNNFLFSGTVTIKNIGETSFNCHYNSNGLDLAKKLKNLSIRDLDLFEKIVYSETDSPPTKQTKWGAALDAQTQVIAYIRPNEVITHYFPTIHARYAYDKDSSPVGADTSTGFIKNHWWSQFINFYNYDESRYMLGNRVLTSVYNTRPGWQTTVAPCPNFVYVLNQALTKFGYVMDKSQLLDLPEVKHLFIFANKVMDKVESFGTYMYNVYGASFKLEDFLPRVDALELPLALKQLFLAVFYEQEGRIKVIAGKDLLNQKSVDWSAYSDAVCPKEVTDYQNYEFEFVEKTGDAYFKLYPEQMDKVVIDNSQDSKVVVNPNARPMVTLSGPRGNVWGTWVSGTHEETSIGATNGPLLFTFENKAGLGHNAQVKSDLSEESPTDVIDSLLLGVWRGEDFYPDYYPSSTTVAYDDYDGVTFGERSILFPNDDGLVVNFHEDFVKFVNGASVFTKNLTLPPHKLAELIRFEQIKYSFKHPNGNVTGIVRDFEFELSNQGISPIRTNFINPEKR